MTPDNDNRLVVITHSYLSSVLPVTVRSWLKLAEHDVRGVIVFCRWKEFEDKGQDRNIDFIKQFLTPEELSRIEIIEHINGSHSQWECRTQIMNAYVNYPRMWLDSDQLLAGRYNRLFFLDPYTQYRIDHRTPTVNGLEPHQIVIPYAFGKGVMIWYEAQNFLSLDSTAKRTIDIRDVYTINLNSVENEEYLEGRKAWAEAMTQETQRWAGKHALHVDSKEKLNEELEKYG